MLVHMFGKYKNPKARRYLFARRTSESIVRGAFCFLVQSCEACGTTSVSTLLNKIWRLRKFKIKNTETCLE